MAKNSPYGNQPVRVSLAHQQIAQGLKGLKIRAPNRPKSTTAHKSALPKEHESES